jgi:phosphatidate cytidylyltransferase
LSVAGQRSELKQRVVSGIIMAAAAFAAVAAGGAVFALAVALLAWLVFREWMALTAATAFPGPAFAANGAMGLAAFSTALLPGPLALGAIAVCAAAAYTVLDRHHAPTARMAAFAIGYCALAALSLCGLRAAPEGLAAVLMLFAIVWGTDIGAYFVGRRIGGPKLAPAISPGKTRSGAAGGMVIAMAGAAIVSAVTGFATVPGAAAAGGFVSIVSQAGDLFESWLKRVAGVKDSGRIIPGHGGAFDRVDGLLPAAIAFFVIALILGWM